MKIWEILKEENIGKEVKCSTGKEYCIDKNCNYKIGIFKNGISIDLDSTEIMTLDFEFIQQPVTFEEVLNSDKKCRIEHEYLKQNWFKLIITDNIMAKTYLEDVCNYKYMYLKNIMYVLSYRLNSENFKKVMKEAKWYLEP